MVARKKAKIKDSLRLDAPAPNIFQHHFRVMFAQVSGDRTAKGLLDGMYVGLAQRNIGSEGR